MVINIKYIGNIIRVSRKKYNLTQQELADKVITSRSYISDIENGKHNISTELLLKIAIVLDIDLNYLKQESEIHYRKEG
ncbi:MAG: helix-turn-helix domain-containing protein [Halanaerobiales bacterium]